MRYLDLYDIREWCAAHQVPLEPEDSGPAPDPRLAPILHRVYGWDGPSGSEPEVAAETVCALGDWTTCLIWIVLYGVWPSSEDWPAYYARRGARGEPRSLGDAPGHLYTPEDRASLEADLAQLMTFGWEAHVLPASADAAPGVRVFISHDGWLEVMRRALP